MNVSLTQQLEDFVAELVREGRYQSASEVVREGLRLLAKRDEADRLKLDALRQMIRDGLDSGPSAPLDIEEILAAAHAQRVRSA